MLRLQIPAECSGPRWPVGMRHGAISARAGGLDLRFVARDCHNLLTRYRCLGVAGLVDGSISDVDGRPPAQHACEEV